MLWLICPRPALRLALRTLFLSVHLLAVTPPSLPHLILRGRRWLRTAEGQISVARVCWHVILLEKPKTVWSGRTGCDQVRYVGNTLTGAKGTRSYLRGAASKVFKHKALVTRTVFTHQSFWAPPTDSDWKLDTKVTQKWRRPSQPRVWAGLPRGKNWQENRCVSMAARVKVQRWIRAGSIASACGSQAPRLPGLSAQVLTL